MGRGGTVRERLQVQRERGLRGRDARGLRHDRTGAVADAEVPVDELDHTGVLALEGGDPQVTLRVVPGDVRGVGLDARVCVEKRHARAFS
jgi:hypothetical protein